jgi:hypothetical protein
MTFSPDTHMTYIQRWKGDEKIIEERRVRMSKCFYDSGKSIPRQGCRFIFP